MDVETFGRLGRAGCFRIGSGGILHVLDDASVLVEGEDVAVWLPERQQRSRQPHEHLSQERLLRKLIRRGIARTEEADPDAAIAPAHQVVWIAGQVVYQDS